MAEGSKKTGLYADVNMKMREFTMYTITPGIRKVFDPKRFYERHTEHICILSPSVKKSPFLLLESISDLYTNK